MLRKLPGAVRKSLRSTTTTKGNPRTKLKAFSRSMAMEATHEGCSPCLKAWMALLSRLGDNSLGPTRLR